MCNLILIRWPVEGAIGDRLGRLRARFEAGEWREAAAGRGSGKGDGAPGLRAAIFRWWWCGLRRPWPAFHCKQRERTEAASARLTTRGVGADREVTILVLLRAVALLPAEKKT